MKIKLEMNPRNICFIVIIAICIIALLYGVYYEVFVKPFKDIVPEEPVTPPADVEFDKLFDNKVNLQEFDSYANSISKIEPTKDIVYTSYTLNEIYEDKYDIQASIPLININDEAAVAIDREIISTFYGKITNILDKAKEEVSEKAIYTVSYTSYLNENILSLLIKATLKEGSNSQRVIIKAYTYNISTNKRVPLSELLEIRTLNKDDVQSEIRKTIENSINYTNSLTDLGYGPYKRNINNEIYKVDNSNNYFFGPNSSIYIIYAYGNSEFTSEKDIVYIK